MESCVYGSYQRHILLFTILLYPSEHQEGWVQSGIKKEQHGRKGDGATEGGCSMSYREAQGPAFFWGWRDRSSGEKSLDRGLTVTGGLKREQGLS